MFSLLLLFLFLNLFTFNIVFTFEIVFTYKTVFVGKYARGRGEPDQRKKQNFGSLEPRYETFC